MKKIRASNNSSFSMFAIFIVFFLLITPFNAHASYAWVLGSYEHYDNAIRGMRSAQPVKNGKVLVKTRAPGYHYRILAGCFNSKESAMRERGKYLSRPNDGIWLLETNLGCGSGYKKAADKRRGATKPFKVKLTANPDQGPLGERADNSKPFKVKLTANQVAPVFTPRRWKFKGGNKIAYTSGENPALFFDNNSTDCYMTITPSFDPFSQFEPPQNFESYRRIVPDKNGGSQECKIAYIYEVEP